MAATHEINLNAFRERAEAGDADTQYEMAFIENEYTDSMVDDGKRSLAWLEKAANQGHSDAQLTLGLYFLIKTERKLLFKGFESILNKTPYALAINLVLAKLFDTNDDQTAVKWLNQAAAHNNPNGILWLGYCYYNGFGIAQNYGLALELFKEAADHGLSDAMLLIALIYIKGGVGVEVDYKEALIWLNNAVKLNNKYAFYTMGYMHANGKGVQKDIMLAYNWYEKAASLDVSEAQYLVALNYREDEDKYWYWMERAAYTGHNDAKQKMEHHHLELAAHYGSAEAYSALAKRYDLGIGVEKDPKLARYLRERSRSLKKSKDHSTEESSLETKISRLNINGLIGNGLIDDETADNLNRQVEDLYKELSSKKEIEKLNALKEKEREMLSFFTHTMRNALATAPEALRQAIQLLGSEVYEQDSNHYKAINKMTALFSSLSLTDCLIDTFKQSITDPQEFKHAWDADNTGDATPNWVIASALRQALNRILFMSDTTQFRSLLDTQEVALIKSTRKSFIDKVLPLNLDESSGNAFLEWVGQHLARVEVAIRDGDDVHFGTSQTRFSLLFAITSELILNALKYWDGQGTIRISWQQHENGDYAFSVSNHCQPGAASRLAGTHKGLAFIKRLIELLGEQCNLTCQVKEQFFYADLVLKESLFN
jgi:TPR repeat protein/signal transduction histidine kinase